LKIFALFYRFYMVRSFAELSAGFGLEGRGDPEMIEADRKWRWCFIVVDRGGGGPLCFLESGGWNMMKEELVRDNERCGLWLRVQMRFLGSETLS
jgi:hypothetical protein